ncbi:DNA primase [Nocardioides terrae]|uniref:DNA primase n=1 Tax=Nocardioides terrae TaxID=574651 RepID=A0A1I1NIJ6_9ACTN|nr:toprim domain-containing protein [Nocardioides terrae]SFC97236.1 DNA primase [Nocardioides terrae]
MTIARERLITAHDVAAGYFRQMLECPRGEGPRRYLTSRGLDQILDDPRWTVGYAPPGWTGMQSLLHDHGFSDTEILAAGLATTARTGSLIDRFRERLVLGVRNCRGELVGFIGRAAPNGRPDAPRYLNTPTTEVFRKGELLFGLAEQRDRLSAGAAPVIVEGPLDVLAVASATTEFVAVSTCGISLRAEQVTALRFFVNTQTVHVAYDGDHAGEKASRRAYPLLIGAFALPRGARFYDGQDPASVGAESPTALVRTLRASDPLADFLIDHCVSRHPDHATNVDTRIDALHESARLIATLLPADIPRQVARTADKLGLHHSEVSNDLASAIRQAQVPSTVRPAAQLSPSRREPLPTLRPSA